MRDGRERRTGRWAPLLLVLALAGCTAGAGADLSLGRGSSGIDATTPAPPTSDSVTTTVAQTTTTTEPLPGLGVGATGAAVFALEQKLQSLRYYVGQIDEGFDGDTRHAVMAFQKMTGMDRTGRATDDVVAAINATSQPPTPLVPAGGYRRVEIDLDRQVLLFYEGNNVETILPVSTGSNERFCSEGWCRRAVTPAGSFVVYEKRSGWEKSPLGWLYNSQYFNGGIAIHGSTSIPAYPASHGCVRISMSAAEWFPNKLTVGTPVYVVSAEEPSPTPIGLNATPVSTPTTIVPDAPASQATTTTTTTTPNLLNQLLTPSTTRRP